MARYEIIHSCGHVEEMQIYGTNVHGERDDRVRWLESQPCRECRMREFEAGKGLGELKGSDKQVAWARDIRRKMYERVIARLDEMTAPGRDWHESRRCTGLVEWVAGKTDARWYIDRRDKTVTDLVREYAAEIDG